MYEAEAARACDRRDAHALWVRTAQDCAEAGLAWDEAYARWRAAEAALQTSSSPAARELLRRAHRMATDLEAAPLLSEIHALADHARIPLGTAPALGPRGAPSIPNLTKREVDVLALVMAGRTYAEIGADLFISEKTVSAHISHMLRKTNTSSRVELAQLGRRLSADSPRETRSGPDAAGDRADN